MKLKLQAIYCPIIKLVLKITVLEEGFFFTFHLHFFFFFWKLKLQQCLGLAQAASEALNGDVEICTIFQLDEKYAFNYFTSKININMQYQVNS